MSKTVQFKDMGKISYAEAWDYQTQCLNELVSRKRKNQSNDNGIEDQNHYLLFCEHNPVYTLGKSGKEEHLKLDSSGLEKEGVEFFKINRGGDITYHGPGQLTVYPIFDLDEFFTDIHRYVRTLEDVIIELLNSYNIEATREQGYTGVWIEKNGVKRKVCAIGVHLSRWVTMHGLALNVNTDLSYFNHIIPCGIQEDNRTITSIGQELGRVIPMQEIKDQLKHIFSKKFEFEYAAEESV